MAIFRISSIFDLLKFERTAQIGLAKTHEPWKPTLNKQDLNSSISSLQIEGPGKRLTQFTSIFGSTKARMLLECSRSSKSAQDFDVQRLRKIAFEIAESSQVNGDRCLG